MSLYGAMFSGVSGLSAQSSAMGAISDNITNINTIGYKGTTVNFQTLVTKQTATTNYAPGGVQSKPRQGIDVQGLLQASNSSTDMAISGSGMFVVNEAANPTVGNMFEYSRAGSFKVDQAGYMQAVGGGYLQGWPLAPYDGSPQAVKVTVGNNDYMKAYKAASGATRYVNDNVVDATNLKPLNLNTIGGTASATTSVRLGANLPSSALVGDNYKTNSLIYDSLGNSHNLQFKWTDAATNAWNYEAIPAEGSDHITVLDANNKIYGGMARLDYSKEPASGDNLTIGFGAQTYTFNYGAGGDLTDSNGDGTYNINVTTGTKSQAIDDTVSAMNRALNMENNNLSGSLANPATPAGDGSTLDFKDSSGTVLASVTIAGANGAAVMAEINAATATTGVVASLDPTTGNLRLASNNSSGVSVTCSTTTLSDGLGIGLVAGAGTTNQVAIPPAIAYVERISGTDSIVARQGSTAQDMIVGLTGMSASTFEQQEGSVDRPITLKAIDSSYPPATTNAIVFNGDGTPKTIIPAKLDIGWRNGARDMDDSTTNNVISPRVGLFLGDANTSDGMTQLSGGYQVSYLTQNGAKFGNYAGVSVGSNGIVTALFDNGVTRPIFMIPIATFINPNGMNSRTGNAWIETDNSGQPTLRQAGTAGAGTTNQSSLESSTVDLGEEFTAMITTQRAYSAAAKIITTADQMLDELTQIKR